MTKHINRADVESPDYAPLVRRKGRYTQSSVVDLTIKTGDLDCVGRVYRELTVTGFVGRTEFGRGQVIYECECSCGTKRVPATRHSLVNHGVSSCGCTLLAARTKHTKHGCGRPGKKTPEYVAWRGMLDRCNNPASKAYRHYGEKGIGVCDRWKSDFSAFLADMGQKPHPRDSLDRINSSDNYEPANCRWANSTTQARNTSRNVFVVYNNERRSLRELCDETGLNASRVSGSLLRGKDILEALTIERRHMNPLPRVFAPDWAPYKRPLPVSPEKKAWSSMKSRCQWPGNSSYHRYGGRGITVCQSWTDSFESFLADVGPRPDRGFSLDRIDVDGNYEPGNVRWATVIQQANNKRNSTRFPFRGEMKTVAEICRETGADPRRALSRMKNLGWTPEDSMTIVSPQKGGPGAHNRRSV